MEIGPIQGAAAPLQTGMAGTRPVAGFADMLEQALGQLQSISDTANQKVSAMATGQDVEISDVMLAVQAESLAMNLATEVRNRAVEAYQEISRMQF
jgi:flagellar hook-basal body complex protein FliE